MRSYALPVLVLLGLGSPLSAQVTLGTAVPGTSIGINFGDYPQLAPVPGHPAYYAPYVNTNLFFYDGLYWAYRANSWYSSAWYNGPWAALGMESVPHVLLRVPVRYYRQAPPAFRRWSYDAPPRWNEYWGPGWAARHRGWETWDPADAPPLAPLPEYQRDFAGSRYPPVELQQVLRARHYDYAPRDSTTQLRVPQPMYPPRDRSHPSRQHPEHDETPRGDRREP